MKLQERLRELLAKATPGPWELRMLQNGWAFFPVKAPHKNWSHDDVICGGEADYDPLWDKEPDEANAELIALAPTMAAQLDLYEAALRQAALDLHEAAGRFAIHSKLDMPSCAEATRNAARRADEALGATL